MFCECLLGRDFIAHDSVEVQFGKMVKISRNTHKAETDSTIREMNTLAKPNGELESQFISREVPRELRNLNDSNITKLRELEKLVRSLQAEKEQAIKNKSETQEKLRPQDKELKDALA